MRKHQRLAALLEERVVRGDYALMGFPGVREVAAESGVSLMTAHRAVQLLIEKGVVARRPSGRSKAGIKRRPTKGFTVGIIMPPTRTEYGWLWHNELETAAAACGAAVRVVICNHWNDALVVEALRGFDGVFSFQFPNDLPEQAQELIANSTTPVVSLDMDLSNFKIPSILAFPPGCCRTLLDHLYSLGHRRIGCLNTFPEVIDIPLRINEWQEWMTGKKLDGPLYNDHDAKLEKPHSLALRAHALVVSKVKAGGLNATALMCTTTWAALGAMRGLQECGLRVGRDVSIVVVNDEGMSELVYPTLTAIRMPDVTPQLKKCIQMMMRGGKWKGERLMTSPKNQLFVGQSSGPALRA